MRRVGWIAASVTAAMAASVHTQAFAQSCPTGQTSSNATFGHCCWPGQIWSNSRSACVGDPTCPPGLAPSGDNCVASAAAPRPAATQPHHAQPVIAPQPQPQPPPPQSQPQPVYVQPPPQQSPPGYPAPQPVYGQAPPQQLPPGYPAQPVPFAGAPRFLRVNPDDPTQVGILTAAGVRHRSSRGMGAPPDGALGYGGAAPVQGYGGAAPVQGYGGATPVQAPPQQQPMMQPPPPVGQPQPMVQPPPAGQPQPMVQPPPAAQPQAGMQAPPPGQPMMLGPPPPRPREHHAGTGLLIGGAVLCGVGVLAQIFGAALGGGIGAGAGAGVAVLTVPEGAVFLVTGVSRMHSNDAVVGAEPVAAADTFRADSRDESSVRRPAQLGWTIRF